MSPPDGRSTTASARPYVFCGSFQSLCAIEFPLAWGEVATGFGVLRGQWGFQVPVNKGSRNLFAIFVFLETLCTKRMGQLSSPLYPSTVYLYLYGSLYLFLPLNNQYVCSKKIQIL